MLDLEYVAVLDSFDTFSTAVRTAGNSSTTVANIISGRESSNHSIKLSTSTSDFAISSPSKAKTSWQVSDSEQVPVIKATRRRSNSFELEEDGTSYVLKPMEKSRSEYQVIRQNGEENTLVCTISVESAHASSYRLRCDEAVGVRLPVFCFWLVSMLNKSCTGLIELGRSKSRVLGVTSAPFREISKALNVFAAA